MLGDGMTVRRKGRAVLEMSSTRHPRGYITDQALSGVHLYGVGLPGLCALLAIEFALRFRLTAAHEPRYSASCSYSYLHGDVRICSLLAQLPRTT